MNVNIGKAIALLLQKNTAKQRKNAVMEALEWVGLTEHANKKPDKLSGGESQVGEEKCRCRCYCDSLRHVCLSYW